MQLAALSFAPNLLQNKAVGTKATFASTALTPTQADSFTPSAKIRQGNSEESLERQFTKIVETTNAHLGKKELTDINVQESIFEHLNAQIEEVSTAAKNFYRNMMGEGDEQF
jgi:hypothetical protein